MIKTIRIENYKSIEKLVLPLGRLNVFIGENGAGKSNILEAIALAGAAQARKLDNEFLASRGIRVSGPELMRAAFKADTAHQPIRLSAELTSGSSFSYELTNDNQPYSTWQNSLTAHPKLAEFLTWIQENLNSSNDTLENIESTKNILRQLRDRLEQASKDVANDPDQKITINLQVPESDEILKFNAEGIEDFIIYAPENSALRLFDREGQIEPLGINGEGLLKLLRVLSGPKNRMAMKDIKESLRLFSWFDDFRIHKGKSRDRIEIFDQFIREASTGFDQRSASEGFLYIAFYLALFTSNLTPCFFAIDNVDSSLNPKLCETLIQRLAILAAKHNKQVILTTHNPAVLDGLDLGDPDHRLFIISRGPGGQTRARRFEKKPSSDRPRRLSELFLTGALGGLPKGF